MQCDHKVTNYFLSSWFVEPVDLKLNFHVRLKIFVMIQIFSQKISKAKPTNAGQTVFEQQAKQFNSGAAA